MIRVVLVDDHPVVRTGYRRLLEQAGDIEVVAEAGDAAAGYAAFVSHLPDVLGALLVQRTLEGGARGFLTKASSPDCLVVAIRALFAGQCYLAPELSPLLLQRDLQHEAEGLAALSAREFEVFRLLTQGHSSAQCAQAMNLSPKTIANHQSLIKEKLGVATSAALTHLAIRRVSSTRSGCEHGARLGRSARTARVPKGNEWIETMRC